MNCVRAWVIEWDGCRLKGKKEKRGKGKVGEGEESDRGRERTAKKETGRGVEEWSASHVRNGVWNGGMSC